MNTPRRLNDEAARGFNQDEHGVWWHRFNDGRRIRGKYFPCHACGQEFISWRRAIYCSQQCESTRYKSALRTRKCLSCKREFIARKGQRFCSHTCAASKMHADRRRTTTKRHKPDALVNSENPRYSQDDQGQWWYTPGGEGIHPRTRAHVAICEGCGKRYLTNTFHRGRQRFCSRLCGTRGRERTGLKGEDATNWKGGRMTDRRGYVLVYAPDHPSRVGKSKPYVFEHRLVMEKRLGRVLREDEHVHHIDGDRSNNSDSNLELWTTAHPYGQRQADNVKKAREILSAEAEQVKWAREILKLYGDLYPDSA